MKRSVIRGSTAALHKIGIPEDETDRLHKALLDGKTVLILHYSKDDRTNWQQIIDWSSAESVQVFTGNDVHDSSDQDNSNQNG